MSGGGLPLQNSTLSVNLKVTAVALTANTPVKVVSANPNRRILIVQDTGTGSLSFGPATLSFGQGLTLDPSTSGGKQGGIYEFKDYIPMDDIWAVSDVGTTIVVVEGL